MAEWNVSFGRTAQFVVTFALIVTAGSFFFIYHYSEEPAAPVPQAVDPFDRSELTVAQQDFFRAVDKGDVREVRRMLQGDTSLAKVSIEPFGTPLHIAATRDMVDMARALLDAGADIDATGQWGGSPLHWAAYLGRIDTLRLLIERGAAIEQRCTVYGATPLLWASYGSVAAERWQYNRYRGFHGPRRFEGTDGEENWEAERARRRAQRDQDYADCVQTLIDVGADINTKNRDGVPAVTFGIPLVRQLLLDHGAKNDYVPPPPPPDPDAEPTPAAVEPRLQA